MNAKKIVLAPLIVLALSGNAYAYTFNNQEPEHSQISQIIEKVENSFAKIEVSLNRIGEPDYKTQTIRYQIVVIHADNLNNYYEAITASHILLPSQENIQFTIKDIVIERNLKDQDQTNDKEYLIPVKYIAYDPLTDLALISFGIPNNITIDPPITEIELGNAYKLKQGDRVIAIGSPVGDENTKTDGQISEIEWDFDYADFPRIPFIQHQAPVAPGNSGGPLINFNGELVGVNALGVKADSWSSATVSSRAIPSNIINEKYSFLKEQLGYSSKVKKVLLPFQIQRIEFSEENQKDYYVGLKIKEIYSSKTAGNFKKDYLILRVGGKDGEQISNPRLLTNILTYSYYKEGSVKFLVAEAEYGTEKRQGLFKEEEIEVVKKINNVFELELELRR